MFVHLPPPRSQAPILINLLGIKGLITDNNNVLDYLLTEMKDKGSWTFVRMAMVADAASKGVIKPIKGNSPPKVIFSDVAKYCVDTAFNSESSRQAVVPGY